MGVVESYQESKIDDIRDEVVALLKNAYAQGVLDVDTMEKRIKKAINSNTKAELLELVEDISLPTTGSSEAASAWSINKHDTKNEESIIAIFGESVKGGRWTPARKIRCCHIMGGARLDFREAELPRSGVSIHAFCFMGSLEVIIPNDVGIFVAGIPIFGGINDATSNQKSRGAPDISIKALTIMGGVSVKNIP